MIIKQIPIREIPENCILSDDIGDWIYALVEVAFDCIDHQNLVLQPIHDLRSLGYLVIHPILPNFKPGHHAHNLYA